LFFLVRADYVLRRVNAVAMHSFLCSLDIIGEGVKCLLRHYIDQHATSGRCGMAPIDLATLDLLHRDLLGL
jgi:hypothetical protein